MRWFGADMALEVRLPHIFHGLETHETSGQIKGRISGCVRELARPSTSSGRAARAESKGRRGSVGASTSRLRRFAQRDKVGGASLSVTRASLSVTGRSWASLSASERAVGTLVPPPEAPRGFAAAIFVPHIM